MSDDEIRELKRRLADLEGGSKPAAGPPSGGYAWTLAKIVLVMAALGTLIVLTTKAPETSTSTAAPSTPPVYASTSCNEPQAKALVSTAQRNLIADIGVNRSGVKVMVRPVLWQGLGYTERETIVSAVDCALAGSGHHLVKIIVETPAGQQLGQYSAIDLSRLRRTKDR